MKLLTLITLLPSLLFGAISLDVTASRTAIFHGESFNLTLSVNGADAEIKPPDFASSDPAEIQFLGSHSNSRSSLQIINGRMTRDVFRGRVFDYAVKPRNEGVYRTGPIIVTVNGTPIKHSGITVQVKGIESQDRVIVSVKASSEAVLVEEPFTITLSVAIRELPEPYGQSNEPLHASSTPQLSADFLEIQEKKGTLIPPDLNQILNSLIDQSGRAPAFAINNYKSPSMGFGSFFNSGPFEAQPIRFRLSPAQIEIDGKRYREYTLTLSYTATGEGQHTFGPVTFKGKVITDVTKQLEAVFDDVYTIGAAVTVRITPPPDEGRPEDFIGSVGKNMRTSAQFDTTVCKVGDPLTLTLEITGDISITNLRTPTLGLQPELTRDFRIYDDSVKTETLKNGKRFSYRVRPTKAGTLEFPPIRISYYDTAIHAYKTITTEPIPVQAEATTQVAALENASEGAVIEVRRTMPMPSGITLTPDGTVSDALLPEIRLLLPLLLGMPLLVLLVALAGPITAMIKRFRSVRVRSGALAAALHAIRRAGSIADLSHAVRRYITSRLEVSGHSLTGREIETLLRERHLSPSESREFSALIARLDEAMYKPGSDTLLENLRAQCATALKSLDTALQHSPSATEEEL